MPAPGWGQFTPSNPRGQTLVLEGGPPEIPMVDAVVDIDAAGKGPVVRYGGRLRGVPLSWVRVRMRGSVLLTRSGAALRDG